VSNPSVDDATRLGVAGNKDHSMRGALLAFLLAALLWPADGRTQPASDLFGRWAGVVGSDGGDRSARVVLQAQRDGFDLDIAVSDIPALQARLVPSAQPHVYQVAAASGGLFGFFEGSGGASPLDGAPLIWARVTATGLVAYRLAIAPDGGMGLARIAMDVAGGGLEVAVERRVDAHPPERWQGTLEREG
jgi:hypothetical protein